MKASPKSKMSTDYISKMNMKNKNSKMGLAGLTLANTPVPYGTLPPHRNVAQQQPEQTAQNLRESGKLLLDQCSGDLSVPLKNKAHAHLTDCLPLEVSTSPGTDPGVQSKRCSRLPQVASTSIPGPGKLQIFLSDISRTPHPGW